MLSICFSWNLIKLSVAAMASDSEYNFACQKCPRTFKLQEFYEKHQKVHLLKKQHVCTVCGFVYGAAKGLEGHMESAHNGQASINYNNNTTTSNNNNNNNNKLINNQNSREVEPEKPENLSNKPPLVRPKLSPSSPMDLSQHIPEMPFLHFLQAQGVLSSTDLIKQAQQAMIAQMTNNARQSMNALSMVPISISAPTSPNQSSPNSTLQQKPNDKSRMCEGLRLGAVLHSNFVTWQR